MQVAGRPVADLAFAPSGDRLAVSAGRPGSTGGVATALTDARTPASGAVTVSVDGRQASAVDGDVMKPWEAQ